MSFDRPHEVTICTFCRVGLLFAGTRRVHPDTLLHDLLSGVWDNAAERPALDVYHCPRCGRLELFIDGVGQEVRDCTAIFGGEPQQAKGPSGEQAWRPAACPPGQPSPPERTTPPAPPVLGSGALTDPLPAEPAFRQEPPPVRPSSARPAKGAAWKCPNCGAAVPGHFEICRNCTTARPGPGE